MNRFVICLAVIASLSLVVESAQAGHGRRVIRAHHVGHVHHHGHAHIVHRAPVVHHHAVVRVPAYHSYYAPQGFHPHLHATHVYPAYGHSVVRPHVYVPARIYVGSPVFSMSIGF